MSWGEVKGSNQTAWADFKAGVNDTVQFADWNKPAPWPVVDKLSAPPIQQVEAPSPYDAMTQDEVLLKWQEMKNKLATIKDEEMAMRKYIVKRAFPNPDEGMNTAPLGNGYQLKAGVKFNYTLDPDLDKVEDVLSEIAAIGNEGPFIADRLVKWSADFLVTEYRPLQDEHATDMQKEIKNLIDKVLTITEAAPSLEIKAPKEKK